LLKATDKTAHVADDSIGGRTFILSDGDAAQVRCNDADESPGRTEQEQKERWRVLAGYESILEDDAVAERVTSERRDAFGGA